MKRMAYFWLAASALAVLLTGLAAAQSESLGDYARTVRKQKGQPKAPRKQFDDDTMPKTDTISVVGHPPVQTAAEQPAEAKAKAEASDQDADANEGDKTASKPGKSKTDGAAKSDAQGDKDDKKDEAAEREKANKAWQKRLSEQKNQIDMLSREVDVMQREYRLRAAAMYGDAGNRLRNSTQWDKEDTDYKQKIEAKQKTLDDAKQQLEDMKEQARKEGVPASMRE